MRAAIPAMFPDLLRALIPVWLAVALLVPSAGPAAAQGGPVTIRAPGAVKAVPLPMPRPELDDASGDAAGSGPETVRAPERPEPPEEEEEEEPDPALAALDPDLPVVETPDVTAFAGVFVPYRISNGREIQHSLTGEPGDPVAGRALFYNASRTGCSLCHGSPELPREPADARDAPDLYRVGGRLTTGHMRLWVVAPEAIQGASTMPAFHKPGQRIDPSDPLFGGPTLTAAEVEDVVAYLAATTGAGAGASPASPPTPPKPRPIRAAPDSVPPAAVPSQESEPAAGQAGLSSGAPVD